MCGLIAVSGTVDSAFEVFVGLMNLQHRGQDGAGILSVDAKRPGGFQLQKGSGLVDNVFSERTFKNLKGTASLGHSRYATIGRDDPNLLQPFLDYQLGIGIGHNGNIVNFYHLRQDLFLESKLQSDSELILRLLGNHLADKELNADNVFDSIKKCMSVLVGSYAVAGVTKDGDIFGFRDPNGIRPLVYGKKQTEDGEQAFCLASESVALNFLGYEEVGEIAAGEAIFIDKKGKVDRQVLRQQSFAPCMFEWVYFARVESQMSGTPVYDARFSLGFLLADRVLEEGVEADVVVPVPETSRIAAVALAETLGLPFRELLIKNRYVNRTFILDGQQSRQEAIRRKLFPIASEFEGKSCLIVDDSIVRGNTAKQIVKLVRQAGAREVILVSSCPQIAHPCYYGIDFPHAEELAAHNRTDAEIAAELGCDKVIFQTVEGLQSALKQKSLCTGCLTGNYPTSIESGKSFGKERQKDRELSPSRKDS
ncbi:MAG TPA: amidophosphoribosyltransferase [Planktothrix sp.]|jgi:amidophosphoribosyltransferase